MVVILALSRFCSVKRDPQKRRPRGEFVFRTILPQTSMPPVRIKWSSRRAWGNNTTRALVGPCPSSIRSIHQILRARTVPKQTMVFSPLVRPAKLCTTGKAWILPRLDISLELSPDFHHHLHPNLSVHCGLLLTVEL